MMRRVVRRSKALGELAATDWSPEFGGLGGWRGAEVLVLEPVGIAFEVEDLGVVDEPIDHRGGNDVVAEDLAPANCLLLVTIIDARSYREETSANIRFAAWGSNGM